MSKEIEMFESHFERLDREKQALDAEYRKVALVEENETKRAKMKAREATKEMLIAVFGFIAAAAVLITLCLVWFTDIGEDPQQSPKVSEADREQAREEKCFENGGGWLPAETFRSQYPEAGMCIYPGSPVEKVDN